MASGVPTLQLVPQAYQLAPQSYQLPTQAYQLPTQAYQLSGAFSTTIWKGPLRLVSEWDRELAPLWRF